MINDATEFLITFVPKLEIKSTQLNKATWLLETTGSKDAADLKADLETELRFFYSDKKHLRRILKWLQNEPDLNSRRQLQILLQSFKQHALSPAMLQKLARKETDLSYLYATFRPLLDAKPISENEIRTVLKTSHDPLLRQKTWEASKKIGDEWGKSVLELVKLRNDAAKSLGYKNYFEMQLDIQEVDENWLFQLFEDLAQQSEASYLSVLAEIEKFQVERFKVPLSELGPWAWSEPFSQEDPIGTAELDPMVADLDIVQASTNFFHKMGFDVTSILARSDMFERLNKNPHAFCINIDRKQDIRTLNNIASSLKWLETVLHELGHAVYEQGLDQSLPWTMREPAHTLTTEAMALLCGRQAYRLHSLPSLVKESSKNLILMKKAEDSLRRRQLIFSRWVLVVTYFERELYAKPNQDLNSLWWHLVEKYQKITPPKNRQGKMDWSTKQHIPLAPAYYFSYLLGELFASSLEIHLLKLGKGKLTDVSTAKWLNAELFAPGKKVIWHELIKKIIGQPLTPKDWLTQFC